MTFLPQDRYELDMKNSLEQKLLASAMKNREARQAEVEEARLSQVQKNEDAKLRWEQKLASDKAKELEKKIAQENANFDVLLADQLKYKKNEWLAVDTCRTEDEWEARIMPLVRENLISQYKDDEKKARYNKYRETYQFNL
jgi:hypothetical protein